MNRDYHISTRVTHWELKLIQSKAKQAGMGKSEFIRRAALDKPVVRIDGIEKLHSELNRIGNNINQITVIMHKEKGKIQQVNFTRVKEELEEISHKVDMILEMRDNYGDYQNGQRKVG